MKKRQLFFLAACCACLMMLIGCTKEQEIEKSSVSQANELEPSLVASDNGNYVYALTNNMENEVTFDFTSGQRYDFSLSNDTGVVHLFSSVAMFAQSVGEETVKAGEKLEYPLDIPVADLEPGTYTLKAWLTPSEGPKYETEAEYTVQ